MSFLQVEKSFELLQLDTTECANKCKITFRDDTEQLQRKSLVRTADASKSHYDLAVSRSEETSSKANYITNNSKRLH